MKRNRLLFASVLMSVMMPAFAQTEVTNQYIVNAGFDDGTMSNGAPKGWTFDTSSSLTNNKISTGEKGGGVIAAGQNHWQLYKWDGAIKGKAYQKATGLVSGTYKLTLAVSASFSGTLNLYLNDQKTAIVSGDAKVYEVEAEVGDDGAIEFGLDIDVSGNQQTIDFDSFQLYLMEETLQDPWKLVNPNFDDATFTNSAPKGWNLELTSSGVSSKISTGEKGDGVIAANQNHWQLWQQSGALTGKAFQKLTGVPEGRYKATMVMVPSFSGSVDMYLNDEKATITSGTNQEYTVEGLVYDGTLELGLALNVDNGATLDFDTFTLTPVDAQEGDVAEIVARMKKKCEADIAKEGRQTWYNKDEMDAAFKAAEEAQDDEAKLAAVKLMQTAHANFEAIEKIYDTMRDAATALYDKTKETLFYGKDDVKKLYDQMETYFATNEDQRQWMQDKLADVASLEDAFFKFSRVLNAIDEAQRQMDYTNYEGKDVFKQAIKDTEAKQATAKTAEEYQAIIDEIQKAQETYLKNRPSEWITIQNGNLWMTDDGKGGVTSVQAHAPGFVRVGDVWYMCGEDRSGWWNPDINLYSSVDLVHWKFEKKIVENGVTTPELGHGRMIERPKLMYNAKTDKYVVWCHYESGNYGASEAACFECDKVNGDYKVVWTGRPLNVKSRDCNVFQDNDGTAYFVSTTNENRDLGLFRLSDDYHDVVEHTALFAGKGREAPAIVRVGDNYFMFNSACSGWDPNRCKMSYTTDLKSGWTSLTNVGNDIAYDTQAAAILTIKGTKQTTYLYVGDRWQDPGLPESKTIIFPISFNGTTCSMDYRERFDINFVTGEWRETPTDGIFEDKSGWKVIDYSSQQNGSGSVQLASYAIDGKTNTFWRTNWVGGEAAAPHHITIDMGKTANIKGFLATPRMDDSHFGLIRKYEFQVSNDGEEWATVASGSWLLYDTEVDFGKTYSCRYLKLVCTEGTAATLAELDVVSSSDEPSDLPTAIKSVTNDGIDKNVVARTYYSIDGRQLSAPQKGIYVEKLTYSDGTVETVKKVNK